MKKPKPAPLYDKKNKSYRLNFCYNGKQYKTRYIKDERAANILQNKVNFLVSELKNGLLQIPEGISIKDFIFDKVDTRPKEKEVVQSKPTKLSQIVTEYESNLIPPLKAKTTCDVEKIHIRHLQRFVKKYGYNDPLLSEINVGFFNKYKTFRYQQKIRTDTVKKELSTFQSMFRMVVENDYIPYNVVKDVKRDKSQIPSERFRTHKEVTELLAEGNYDPKHVKEMLRFRYLTTDEIKRLIALAEGMWLHPRNVVTSNLKNLCIYWYQTW